MQLPQFLLVWGSQQLLPVLPELLCLSGRGDGLLDPLAHPVHLALELDGPLAPEGREP